ncbi:MAG: polymorphic toxin type 33 domain-containing protein [Terracidiphilus sp.]
MWTTLPAEPIRSREPAPVARKPERAGSRSTMNAPWSGNQTRLRSLEVGADSTIAMPNSPVSAPPAIAESADKQSNAANQDSKTEPAGEQREPDALDALSAFLRPFCGPPKIANEMSEQEKRAHGVALVSADQIELSLADALETLHDARVASSRSTANTAAAAKRSISLNVQKEKDNFERAWELQDIDTKSAILAEYESLRDDYATRQSQVQQRVEVSTTGVTALFSEYQPNFDRAAQEGGEACEKARLQNRHEITKDFYEAEDKVTKVGSAINSTFGHTDRDDAMRAGVDMVDEKVSHEMDERLVDAQNAIDDFFLKQPSTDPGFSGLPEEMRPRVTMQSIIANSSKKVQDSFGSHEQGIIDQIKETGPEALDSLNSIYAGESSYLDQIQLSADDQLTQLKGAAFDRIDLLGKNASDQIDQDLPITKQALIRVEAGVRRRLNPLGKKAIALLRSGVAPEEQESRAVAADLSRYFQSSADFAASGMADGASHVSVSLLRFVRRTEPALAAESSQDVQYANQFGLEVSDQIDKLQQSRIGQMQSSLDQLNEALDDCDTQFIDHFASMVQDFRNQIQKTIDSMNSTIAEGMQEAKNRNQAAVNSVGAAMRAEADDRGYKYDHRGLHALKAGLKFGWKVIQVPLAVIKATLGFIVSIVKILAVTFIIALGLVLFGVEAAIAEAIAEIVVLGKMAYDAFEAYRARRAAGQSVSGALLGTVGDVTGFSAVYHGFTDKDLTLPERVEMITSGVENFAMLTKGKEINKRIGELARDNAPWLDEPPTPPSPSAPAIAPPSAPGGTLPEGASSDANAGWQPPPLKRLLADWSEAQNPRSAGGEAIRPPAPAASPAESLAPVESPPQAETPANGAAGAPAPTAKPPKPVQVPVIDSHRPANDNAIAIPEPQPAAPAAGDTPDPATAQNKQQTTPETAEKPASPVTTEDISPDDPRLKEQDVHDIRPRIAQREAAKHAQQAVEEVVVQNDNVEIEQANEDTGQEIQATAAGGGGGGRRVGPGGGSYRKSGGSGGGRTTTSGGGSETISTGDSGGKQSNFEPDTPQPSPATQGPAEPAAHPLFESGNHSDPEAVANRLRLAGLEPGEIVSFGAEKASELTEAAARRAARLGEHFSAGDMKSLGAFLEDTGLVMDDALANTLIEGVPPGELADTLQRLDILRTHSAESGIAFDTDPENGVNIDESGIKPGKPEKPQKTEGPEKPSKEVPPAQIPIWRKAELALRPVLERIFGPGWKASTRFRPKRVRKGELLGSTVPEYYREATGDLPAMAFEVKRFDLEEMGIGRDGRVTATPSKRTVEALLRARLQLKSRKWNLPEGTEQNLVFNITGQGVTDVGAVGETLTRLIENNRIEYDHVYVQNGSALIEIGITDPASPVSVRVSDSPPAAAPPARPLADPAALRNVAPPEPGANIKLLSKQEIKRLQKSGFNVHEEKGEGNVAQYDLYKDSDGNVWVKMKGGRGEAEFTGWKLRDR